MTTKASANRPERKKPIIDTDDTPVVKTAPAATGGVRDGVVYYPVDLPSNGHFGYPATLEYRDIMVKDEKLLSTATKANYSVILNNILKSLLKEQDCYQELTIYDRDFLLLWIWANNYSPIKKIKVECAYCEHEDNVEIDLTKLDVREVDPTLEVPFVLDAGNDEPVLKLSMITVGDQMATDAYTKDHPEADYDTILYSMTIDTGTVMPMDRKIKWIENNIKGRTMALVRAFHEHYQYGVKDKLQNECSVCHEVTHYRLPFRPEWLRPTVQDDFETLLRLNGKSGNQSD
jgi:hypothetical protein